MSSKFRSFLSFRENPGFETSNSKLNEVVGSYTFLEFSEKNDSELNFKIAQNLKESNVIIISHYEEQGKEKKDLYFVISFKKTILIINESQIEKLQTLLSENEKSEICFLFGTKTIFNIVNDKFKEAKIKYKEIKNDENFENDILKINNNFYRIKAQNFPYKDILHIIKSSISGYLIKQSYYPYNRIDKFNDLIKPREITEDEIIELRSIGAGNESQIVLYYYIEYEKLIVIKKYYVNNSEKEKLLKREIQNYKEIKHPFIPKFYGTIKIDNLCYPVIEFINGKSLSNTDFSQFSETEIYEIIFQMFLVFNYLHGKHFIYRDLKPDNVMIDENNILVLIDFDRMVKENYTFDENAETADFTSFASPEINSNNITNKLDIYSIGKMIDFIMNKSKSVIKNYKNTKLFQIYNKCIDYKAEIKSISLEIFYNFISFITKSNIIDVNKIIYYLSFNLNQNYPETQFIFGSIYYDSQYISRDIYKAIYCFEKAANQNDSEAQFYLGLIYEEGQYISRDMNKSIYYYSLAANQNHPDAQYNLGLIYYLGQYISRDIDKAIYYFKLASDLNYLEAQFILGKIYTEGVYISRDINKAIYYFEKAANQNDPKAQYNLGKIYHFGQYISRDINKAIYYYSLAASQNDSYAQFYLGLIYHLGQYISRDINKAIYYYSLAANQNIPQAQYNLGVIYYLGQYISRDINKAIYYFTMAANQNVSHAQYNLGLIYAQFNLGVIYKEGKYISRDINKAIHYFSLAANQNHPDAQFYLGFIYEKGQYISRDINKAIHYYSLAANQNMTQAQFYLGNIYCFNQYISRDINKAIYYFTMAANQNDPKAQFMLGLIYYLGIGDKQNIKRSIYWFTQSSKNDCIEAYFVLGFLYQEGKYIKRNIDESIKYYKKASSFNDQYAKNNLSIIYKNYFEKKYDYTVYFEEAIRQKNDPVSMYNLSHAYIYEYKDEKLINKSIELLIKSSSLGFKQSTELLCLIILKRFFNKQTNENELINIENIENELLKFNEETNKLKYSIINIIQKQQLYHQSIFKYYYKKYEEIEFVYDMLKRPDCIQNIYSKENILKLEDSHEKYNITTDFYEGFGHDI